MSGQFPPCPACEKRGEWGQLQHWDHPEDGDDWRCVRCRTHWSSRSGFFVDDSPVYRIREAETT